MISLLLGSLVNLSSALAHPHNSRDVNDELEHKTQQPLATAPFDNEACFAPDEPCADKLIQFMQSAKQSLDVAIYELTDKKIVNAAIELSKTIKVRFVVNVKQSDASSTSYAMLKAAHIPVQVGNQKGIMHNKFTIVDGKRLELGSFNYTYKAASSNQENQLYLSTPSVVERYQARFELMFKNGKAL